MFRWVLCCSFKKKTDNKAVKRGIVASAVKTTMTEVSLTPRVKLTEAMVYRLRYAGAKIARSRVSSKVIFAETYGVGRGVVDISISSDTSKEIINLGNEIVRNF